MTTTLFELSEMLSELENALGTTPEMLAGALGVSSRTMQRWRDGDVIPQAESRTRLLELVRLRDRLLATFVSPEMVRAWMEQPNRVLGGLRPIEAARVGRLDTIERALEALDSGIFV